MAKNKVIESITCHICGVGIDRRENDPVIGSCPCCSADFQNKNETLRDKVNCNWFKSLFSSISGTLLLTDKRLVYVMNNDTSTGMAFAIGGLLGALIASRFKSKGAAQINIPVENISYYENSMQSVRKGIRIHTADGNSYKFISMKTRKWAEKNLPRK